MNKKTSELLRLVHGAGLGCAEVKELIERLQMYYQALVRVESQVRDQTIGSSPMTHRSLKGREGHAWVEPKMVNGCGPYLYLRWRVRVLLCWPSVAASMPGLMPCDRT
jgi:hypothetical protein